MVLLPSIADTFIKIKDLQIAYKDEGQGQILLCLHAIGHSSKDFVSLCQLDKNQYRIIAIDFPGHGKSDAASQHISSTYYFEIIKDLIKKLDLKNVILIGNSIGGAVAIRLAIHNSNIKMISLSNTAGLDKKGFFAPLFLYYMKRFFKEGVNGKTSFKTKFEKYYDKVLPSEMATERKKEIVESGYQLAPLLVQAWDSFGWKTEDLRPVIPKISCPVLFTWGMKDAFVRFGRNKNAIEKFSHHKVIKYNIGHTPYLECPDVFLADFQAFIAENVNPNNR